METPPTNAQQVSEYHFTDEQYALWKDSVDPLKEFRQKFHYPKMKELLKVDLQHPSIVTDPNQEVIYLCGNSLGLQPRAVRHYIDQQLTTWAQLGVQGHFNGPMPWALCDEYVNADCGKLVGASPEEVAVMNGLTVNLHLLLFAFYQPKGRRCRILLEHRAFPSDFYAFQTHARLHGYHPDDILLTLKPREGETCLRSDDIIATLRQHGDSIAVVCLSGVQFYTGQLFNMQEITRVGQEEGCIVGWDLAHAIGNVELALHQWNVDFACWCTYKYLNSGAGGIAGIFVHSKYRTEELATLQGWWTHRLDTRFDMTNEMDAERGAAAFRISNPPILLCCALRASLDVFNAVEGGMHSVRTKSVQLTAYLEQLLEHWFGAALEGSKERIEIITPRDPQQRGAQLSLRFAHSIDRLMPALEKRGVVCDERRPNVLRVAPAPLYNSFHDVWRFVNALRDIFASEQW